MSKRQSPRRRRRWTLLQRLGRPGWLDPRPMHEWERYILLRDIRRAVEDGAWRRQDDGTVYFTASDIRAAFPGAYTGGGGRSPRPRSKALEEALERLSIEGELRRGEKKIRRSWGGAVQTYILNPDRERLRAVA